MKELVHIRDVLNKKDFTVCTRSGRIVGKSKIQLEELFDENHECKIRDTCIDIDCDFNRNECGQRFEWNIKKIEFHNLRNLVLMPRFVLEYDEFLIEFEVLND